MAITLPPMLIDVLLNFTIFLIVTLSLNLEVGYAGIPQFGRVLAVIAGAIAAGAIPGRLLVALFNVKVTYGGEEITPIGAEYANHLINFKLIDKINNEILFPNPGLSIAMIIFTLIIAALIGGVIGYLTSYPALRLREAYLGITLLAFGDALKLIAENYQPIVGATQGVFIPNFYGWVGPGEEQFTIRIAIMFIAASLIFIFVERLTKSPYGRSLKAMRDSETAAKVYGKNVPRLRGYTLFIGGALAAIGGALYALYTSTMDARTYDRLTWTFWPWAFMMLGGTGNNYGIVLGVFLFSLFRTIVFGQKHILQPFIPIDVTWLEYIIIGLIIIAISLFRPQGLIPEKIEPILKREEIEEVRKRVSRIE